MKFFNHHRRTGGPAFLAILLILVTSIVLTGRAAGQESSAMEQSKTGEMVEPEQKSASKVTLQDFGSTPPDLIVRDEKRAEKKADEADLDNDLLVSKQNGWYVRPDRKARFRGYVKSVVGPVSLARYTATAGLGTYRNAPSEWGDKWEGFGRRFASSLGKSAIQNTVQYGLDEALKLDSKFYPSRNRSISAKVRNAVFSAVTARDKQGKRVIGAPRLVGRVVSNVVASETWYPPRYDYVHGLKGAAISTAISVGTNLFREFVLNR